MGVELSRQAALALSSPLMIGMDADARQQFVHAVEQAKDKSSLPKDVADLLEKALASIKKR